MRWLALLCLIVSPAFAQQQGEIYEPPRSEAGEAYRTKAKAEGIAVDARTLSKDAPVTLRPPRAQGPSRQTVGNVFEGLGWLVLVGFVALLAVALFRSYRSGLFTREPKPEKPQPQMVELADMGSANIADRSLADIARMDDPREALRLLLLMALAKAAEANDIVLARSLTARDVFARVPKTWRRRDVLELLVGRAELVLFGGRPFAREDLTPLLEASEPMLRGRP